MPAEKPRAPTNLARWADRCLRLYPRAWRLRYREEMLALLDRHPLTLWTLADLLIGALDAHLHRHLLPVEVFSMTQRIRTSANAILAAFALFFVAWLMVPFISDSPAQWNAATASHPEIPYTLAAFEMVGVVAVLALLVGGLPLLAVIARQALRERRRDLIWRLAMPVLLAGVLVAYSFVAVPGWWHRQPLGPHDLTIPAVWLRRSFFALAFLILGVSTWAITSAAARSQPGERVIRFTIIPGALVAQALCACLAALVTLTILVFVEAPQLARPLFLMPGFDLLLLGACWIAVAATRRMAAPA